ncbi:MAG TPA: hypothetical protein VJ732_11235, partial [Bryobacteraceae bacterium]|nr:hypothetical protein [Bryobacteraceae bacterium]
STVFGIGLIVSVVALPTTGSASPMTTCPPMTTFNQYLSSGFSCVIDNVLFDNFTFSSTGGVPISASNVTVQPVADTGGLYFPFSPSLTVNALPNGNSTSAQFTIGMDLTGLGTSNVTGLTLDANGFGQHGGSTTVAASYCLGQALVGCPAADLKTLSVTDSGTNAASFAGVHNLGLSFTTSVVSGIQGTATLQQFEFGVTGGAGGGTTGGAGGPGGSPIPEPGTWLMLAGGLASLLLWRQLHLKRALR